MPMEGPRDLSIILEYDVLVTDIVEDDFARIGQELGVLRLSPGRVIPRVVAGLIYKDNKRIFVPLVVEKRDRSVNVLFLLDTGSPATFLRKDTLNALGHEESIPEDSHVLIEGRGCLVRPSVRHYENVDLLGQDFLDKADALLTVDYKRREVKLTFQ